jgi:hypothetical protein
MNSIDSVSSCFLEIEREGRKYFACHYVEGNRILPYPKPLKPSVDVLAIHVLRISISFNLSRENHYSSVPPFQYSMLE